MGQNGAFRKQFFLQRGAHASEYSDAIRSRFFLPAPELNYTAFISNLTP